MTERPRDPSQKHSLELIASDPGSWLLLDDLQDKRFTPSAKHLSIKQLIVFKVLDKQGLLTSRDGAPGSQLP